MTSHSRHSVTATTSHSQCSPNHRRPTGSTHPKLPTTHTALTVPEVMAALRLSRFKVYDLIRSGELPSFRIGRARRIPADAVHAFMQHQIEEAA